MSSQLHRASLNWLGFLDPYPQASSRTGVLHAPSGSLGALLHPKGESVACEKTDVMLWHENDTFYLHARCHTADMPRVRALAARPIPYARDAWGDDALEVSIDVGQTRQQHLHFILPPNGLPVTFLGANNRFEHGWHPRVILRVLLEEAAWVVEAAFPFTELGRIPQAGETWGFNVLRVNPNEPCGYVQWAPTFGDALRTELFGEIEFSGIAGDRSAEIIAYAKRAAARKGDFLSSINAVTDAEALHGLGVADWGAWGRYIERRSAPVPIRWDDVTPGRVGITDREAPWLIASADEWVEKIAGWSADPADPAALAIEPLEALGDAFLLTADQRYVDAFERAIILHACRVKTITKTVDSPDQLPYHDNPYFDAQITRTAMLSYAYLHLVQGGLSPEAHAAMMTTVLRGCRFAAWNISGAYTYGNHQVYESAGLATVAALFPEFSESDSWARTADRSLRLHLEREVYPDGGYQERCGYHSVAMSFAMHAVATIHANGLETRFPELMAPATQKIFERMHEWLLMMLAPDGTFPAFGDCGASSMLRYIRRGSSIFDRPDFACPLHQLTPALVPDGIEPHEPETCSVSLASHFTVMRDGWMPDSFYMAVDHGPLGGQHSHLDTLGFTAYAFGRPVALDSGIGVTYEDARYIDWFRTLRAHNVIVIDDVETEKVAALRFWKPGAHIDVLGTRSRAYEHALGILHDRTFFFVKGVGWLIHDRLYASDGNDLARHYIEWLLHTPSALVYEGPGVLHAEEADGGLLVLAAFPEALQEPRLEMLPASVPITEARDMRLWDVGRLGPQITVRDHTLPVTTLAWPWLHGNQLTCEFATMLLPYLGSRPEARIIPCDKGFVLYRAGEADIIIELQEG